MRADLAADPRLVVQTLRTLRAEALAEVARLTAELKQWETRAGVRPADGSDQPSLFESAAQPKLF